ELAHRVDAVVLDKTGTLTEGQPRLTACWPAPGWQENDVLPLAAALQAQSAHPLARAVVQAAQVMGQPLPVAQNVQAVPGRGGQGLVDGRLLYLGSLRWMAELDVPLGAWADVVVQAQSEGATLSVLVQRVAAGDWKPLALLAFADAPKPGAAAAVAALRALGLRVVMLSGDNRAAAVAMAQRLGLRPDAGEVEADVLPADKAAYVRQLQAQGHCVAMVGDGVNDAPALAAADVGLAMSHTQGGGSDVAMHAAGITLMRGDPALIAASLDISRRTVRKIRQNLFWAFVYNVAGIPLAALGFLNPVLAGAAMALSSVSVMANALWLKRWHPHTR
ncbi:MAG: HAD-IC family P-type ATPase, partial [Macromonas sp.]